MKAAKNKHLIWVIIFAIVSVVVIILIVSKKAAANSPDPSYFPLKYGDANVYVQSFQQWLIKQGENMPSGADGIFGDETKAALLQKLGITEIDITTYKKYIS